MTLKTPTQLPLAELAEASNLKPNENPPKITAKKEAGQREKAKKTNWELLLGTNFGDLTLLKILPARKALCLCVCGKQYETWQPSLLSGDVKSCGCMRKKYIQQASKRRNPFPYSKNPLFRAWAQMRQRCQNPKDSSYAHYGARGVKVCLEWDQSFEKFVKDMGERPSPKHSIDRINNSGNYEPSNCRWATPKQQVRNRGATLYLTLKGITKPAAEWAEDLAARLGLTYQNIADRRYWGWSTEKILTTTVRKKTKSA
jgi:hypothetical protein